MKRFLGIILTICMLSGCLFMFTSCKKEQAATGRMTVDINPSVEFMLDKDNKVISATALNDDGEVILYGEAFVGKTAEEAAQMVVKIATETGYLVKGEVTATSDEINISISSDTAQIEDLYKKVENKVNDYVEKNGLSAQLKKGEAIALEELRKYVVNNTEYTEEDVKDMTATQLYAALGATRLEQAELYSEALRDAYVKAKNYEFKFAEKEETAKVIEAMDSAAQLVYSSYKTVLDTYKSAIDAVEKARYDYLVSPDSEYQKTLVKLRDAKEKFLIQKKIVASLDVNDSTYQAQVTNDMQENEMLCVPFFYQKGWTAQIDGEDAGVYNINEGMCGVEVPSGTHEIVLKYETPYQNYGVGMTIIGIIIFILVFSQNLYKFFVKLC